MEVLSICSRPQRLLPEGEETEVVAEFLFKHSVHTELAVNDLSSLTFVFIACKVKSHKADFDLVVCVRVGDEL